MREEYERDLHHAWMILETDELYKEDYQMRMLMENAIPGLLSVRGQGKDDKSQYRYEISGKISVKAKREKEHWKFADLEKFMRQFIQVLYAVKNYLLDVNCLSLDPGHIYVSDEIYYFCYCPGLEGNILEKFHELTEYFVRETDYEQKEAVYLAYELHKASMEENYNIEYALERILEKKENEMESIQPEKKAGYDLQEELILPVIPVLASSRISYPFRRFIKPSSLDCVPVSSMIMDSSCTSTIFARKISAMELISPLCAAVTRTFIIISSRNTDSPSFNSLISMTSSSFLT